MSQPITAPPVVLELVQRFNDNLDDYKALDYKEAELRQEFINPLFEALGWDVTNKQGYSEIYKEVVNEATIKIGGTSKAPDYAFRIGSEYKFFVEAKKPAVKILNDSDPAFQLRRYAWNAKLPINILTNFQVLVVYDCRYEPKPTDPAKVGRMRYWTYDQYIEKWDEIAQYFAKQSILKGTFDKYVAKTKDRKNTIEVDARFLMQLEEWRRVLANALIRDNPILRTNIAQLNYAVQTTLDRIIFLRICEDRGIEPLHRLQGLLNAPDIYARLLIQFREADQRYNSGLFHFDADFTRAEQPDNLTPSLIIDDKTLSLVIEGLYNPSPYDFSVMPADILGQVYEQFLGEVITVNGSRAEVLPKPEVKKAGGVYYTPTYIVDYIIEQTVGRVLDSKTPAEAAKLRILDPACGSGSFLIAAYQRLLNWHLQWYLDHDPDSYAKGKKATVHKTNGFWRLTVNERKRILLNNIFGVDIDAQAVEVTKLSLLLKVLEGESEQSISAQMKLFHDRALPDLGQNIRCGNSLIGYDPAIMKLPQDEIDRINPFDWQTAFPNVMQIGGFDVIIGNPPYGAYLYENDKLYLSTKFPHQSYQLDSYLLFLESAIQTLLKADGFYGVIMPNPWLTNVLQGNLRKFVVDNARIREIDHFLFKVFPKVTVDTEIVILQKSITDNWTTKVLIVPSKVAFLDVEKQGVIQINHEQRKWRDQNEKIINIFTSPAEEALAAKCVQVSVLLHTLFVSNVGIKPYQTGKGKPPQTKEIVETRPFDSDKLVNEIYRPCLRGSDITRYKIKPVKLLYLNYGAWLAEPRPAANFDAPVKIFMRQTGDSLIAAIDFERYLCLNNMHVLVPKDMQYSPLYVLGLLNSRLANWYYHTLNPEVGEALAEVKKTNVDKLLIRTINFRDAADKARHDQMVELVTRMLDLHARLAEAKVPNQKTQLQAQIAATDKAIDDLVYDLYGLTADERAIVEAAT